MNQIQPGLKNESKAGEINPWEPDQKITLSRYDLMMLAETTERVQKELSWVVAWIKNQAEKMGIKIES